MYKAHCAVIFAIAQLSCYCTFLLYVYIQRRHNKIFVGATWGHNILAVVAIAPMGSAPMIVVTFALNAQAHHLSIAPDRENVAHCQAVRPILRLRTAVDAICDAIPVNVLSYGLVWSSNQRSFNKGVTERKPTKL